ncbi:MAG: tRNA dihydrouridine synthase DusB [Magnetococcales bacterium]|nr:tRNA dihydrouridine synthase DusB [Magnetococcales bacterium]
MPTFESSAFFFSNSAHPPLILAPMAGVTDLPFRRIAERYGADLTISEMVASQAMIRNTPKSQRIIQKPDDDTIKAVQIAGSDPEIMAKAARMNVRHGADLIDINMGCPVKKIIKSGSGAALLRDEALIARIVNAVKNAVDVPVSAKIRIGWDDVSRNGIRIAQLLESLGVSWITVHGRTRAQMYRGQADWSYIAKIKKAVSIPVVGNGDITTPQSAQQALECSGVDGLMIGRGTMGKPWLFEQIAHHLQGKTEPEGPDVTTLYQIIKDHVQQIFSHYGLVTGNRMARKHLAWYVKGLPDSAHFRNTVNHSLDAAHTLSLLDDYFQGTLQKTAPDYVNNPSDMDG